MNQINRNFLVEIEFGYATNDIIQAHLERKGRDVIKIDVHQQAFLRPEILEFNCQDVLSRMERSKLPFDLNVVIFPFSDKSATEKEMLDFVADLLKNRKIDGVPLPSDTNILVTTNPTVFPGLFEQADLKNCTEQFSLRGLFGDAMKMVEILNEKVPGSKTPRKHHDHEATPGL